MSLIFSIKNILFLHDGSVPEKNCTNGTLTAQFEHPFWKFVINLQTYIIAFSFVVMGMDGLCNGSSCVLLDRRLRIYNLRLTIYDLRAGTKKVSIAKLLKHYKYNNYNKYYTYMMMRQNKKVETETKRTEAAEMEWNVPDTDWTDVLRHFYILLYRCMDKDLLIDVTERYNWTFVYNK